MNAKALLPTGCFAKVRFRKKKWSRQIAITKARKFINVSESDAWGTCAIVDPGTHRPVASEVRITETRTSSITVGVSITVTIAVAATGCQSTVE